MSGYVVRELATGLKLPLRLSREGGTHPVHGEGILLIRRPDENRTLFALEVDAYGAIVRTVAHALRTGRDWPAESFWVQPWDDYQAEQGRRRIPRVKRTAA